MALSDVTTARLELSRWDPGLHTPALEAINALPEAVRYLNAGVPYTPAETAAQSGRFAAHWERFGFGLWAATVRATGETIGFVGLSHPLWFPALARRGRGRLAPAPARLGQRLRHRGRPGGACRRTRSRLSRIIAVIDPGNTPSIAVANRLGLTHEETRPHPQRPGDIFIYARAL